MDWLFQLHATQPVAQAIGILALVCVFGLAFGSLSVRGIKLGTAGVLFAGILTGSFSKPVDHPTLEFVKDLGLILFVFTIGLQLGPGFTTALRRDGVRLNFLATAIVLIGTALAIMLAWFLGMDFAGALGMLAGATTNTTSLGAVQQSLATLPGLSEDQLALPALAYAVTYPAATIGIIGTLLLLTRIFRIDMKKEAEIFAEAQRRHSEIPESQPAIRPPSGNISDRRIVVTHKYVLGKTIGELELNDRCGAVFSRVTRANVELNPTPALRLQFGDTVQAIGDEASLACAEALLGNSVKDLNQTHFISLFTGIVLGIVVGTMPIVVPGLPQPLQLGLAGGPLVVALALGRIGHIGRLVFYMPANTNLAFREFGIALFFAAVGLAAGPKFFGSVFSSVGLMWLGAGLCVTVLPLLIVGALARGFLHMNFAALGGLLAGSLTDPPALAFVNTLAGSDASSLAYVTVYPMTTLLRIVVAQVLALTLIH
jgi:AspT/YidE/YbjL antiporter-like protein